MNEKLEIIKRTLDYFNKGESHVNSTIPGQFLCNAITWFGHSQNGKVSDIMPELLKYKPKDKQTSRVWFQNFEQRKEVLEKLLEELKCSQNLTK